MNIPSEPDFYFSVAELEEMNRKLDMWLRDREEVKPVGSMTPRERTHFEAKVREKKKRRHWHE